MGQLRACPGKPALGIGRRFRSFARPGHARFDSRTSISSAPVAVLEVTPACLAPVGSEKDPAATETRARGAWAPRAAIHATAIEATALQIAAQPERHEPYHDQIGSFVWPKVGGMVRE